MCWMSNFYASRKCARIPEMGELIANREKWRSPFTKMPLISALFAKRRSPLFHPLFRVPVPGQFSDIKDLPRMVGIMRADMSNDGIPGL